MRSVKNFHHGHNLIQKQTQKTLALQCNFLSKKWTGIRLDQKKKKQITRKNYLYNQLKLLSYRSIDRHKLPDRACILVYREVRRPGVGLPTLDGILDSGIKGVHVYGLNLLRLYGEDAC